MAKRNSVEIVLSARDQATKEIEQAIKKTTREFSSLNRSLKGIGLSSQEIDKINAHIKEVNPNILEKEMKNVRNQLHGLGLSASEIDKITKELNETTKATKKVDTEVKKMSDHAKHNMKKVEHATHKAHGGFMDMYKGALMMSAVMASLAATMAPFIAAVNGIKYNASLEQSAIAFETLLGSAEKSSKMIKDLQEFGANTPFEFEGLQKASQTLLGLGIDSKSIMPTLKAVGNAVSAVGGDQSDLEGIALAIGQINTKGKISAEEMNQLAERGIGAWDILAQKMGKTPQEIMKMSEEGELFADKVLPMLTEGLNEKFGGSMEKQSKTFNGLISTLTDKFKILTGEMTKGAFERLKSVLPPIISFVEKLTEGFKEGGLLGALKNVLPPEVFDKFTMFSEVALDVFDGVKTFIMGWVEYIKSLFTGDGNVGQSLTDMFNTAKAIVMPILTDMIAFIKEKFEQIKQFWNENGDQIIQAIKNFWNVISVIFKTIAPVILFILKMLWDNVKGVIDGALKIIMGLIKVFAGLFTGDFSKMWEGIKQLFFGAIQFVWNLINLMFVGKILGGIKSFATGVVGSIKGMWSRTTGYFKNLLDDATSVFGKIKNVIMKPIQTAKEKVIGFINDIKSAFRNMGVKIKLPHFSVKNFSLNPKDWVTKGLPKLNVDWYDKGGVFYGPQVIGVGEKRPEFVGALDDLEGIVRKVVNEGNQDSTFLSEILFVLRELLNKDTNLYVDGKKLTHLVDSYQSGSSRILDGFNGK